MPSVCFFFTCSHTSVISNLLSGCVESDEITRSLLFLLSWIIKHFFFHFLSQYLPLVIVSARILLELFAYFSRIPFLLLSPWSANCYISHGLFIVWCKIERWKIVFWKRVLNFTPKFQCRKSVVSRGRGGYEELLKVRLAGIRERHETNVSYKVNTIEGEEIMVVMGVEWMERGRRLE